VTCPGCLSRETEAASELVIREGVRLVTLTGPGGVGKSRLALEVAGRLGSSFAHGVRFVDLAPVQRADLVVAAIAAGLRLRTSGGPLIADVKTYLRPRRLVLLLDNFEQVTVAAPLVAEFLTAAAGLVVLVTSRTVLRLSGEHEFPVAPLPTPPAGTAGGPQLADLRQYALVRLFVERALAAAPGLELTSENAEAIAEICRRLDGLPLAIELSAMTWQYWWLRGHTEESARYGEVIVASGEKLPPGHLGYAQIGLGVLLILSGDKARAQVLFKQALALFRRLGDKHGIAFATGYLGHLAALRGD
jgi:hypothetical protein